MIFNSKNWTIGDQKNGLFVCVQPARSQSHQFNDLQKWQICFGTIGTGKFYSVSPGPNSAKCVAISLCPY
jgi:hypothetical protein